MKRWAVLFALLLIRTLHAQTDYSTYHFHFERAGLPVPSYDFLIDEPAQQYTTRGAAPGGPDGVTVQNLHLSAATRRRIVQLFEQTHGLSNCASRAKGIAKTGIKTLSYHLAYKADTFSCTYDYSESKPVQELTALFQSMAFTLDEGRKLRQLHQYDRLGLDAEMKILVNAVKSGQALEMGNIADELKSLADDTEVLERVRSSAATLLNSAASDGAPKQS